MRIPWFRYQRERENSLCPKLSCSRIDFRTSPYALQTDSLVKNATHAREREPFDFFHASLKYSSTSLQWQALDQMQLRVYIYICRERERKKARDERMGTQSRSRIHDKAWSTRLPKAENSLVLSEHSIQCLFLSFFPLYLSETLCMWSLMADSALAPIIKATVYSLLECFCNRVCAMAACIAATLFLSLSLFVTLQIDIGLTRMSTLRGCWMRWLRLSASRCHLIACATLASRCAINSLSFLFYIYINTISDHFQAANTPCFAWMTYK